MNVLLGRSAGVGSFGVEDCCCCCSPSASVPFADFTGTVARVRILNSVYIGLVSNLQSPLAIGAVASLLGEIQMETRRSYPT